MPRNYSIKFLNELMVADPTSLGVQLGRLCVEANLPAAYVAVVLECSRMTVYSWFRGSGVSEKKRKIVEVFIDLVTKDMAAGSLPAKGSKDAKNYMLSSWGVTV